MEFRPCIDIHNGKVKQIVGGSLLDEADFAKENFVSGFDSSFYAKLYEKKGIKGGHVILLNSKESEHYEATKSQALGALAAYPKGLQVGGGITAENAMEFIGAGASHVIVTSYVFKDGKIHMENLEKLRDAVSDKQLVIDLSCRKKDGKYYIVTDRWQKFTDVVLTEGTLDFFADYCDEFLVHAVDVEGKANGIEQEVVKILGNWGKKTVTYAGGIHSYEDLRLLKELGKGRVNATIGSALDLFGGNMEFEEVLRFMKEDRVER